MRLPHPCRCLLLQPGLLPLPPVMRGEGEAEDAEILQALRTTGYFLETHLAPSLGSQPVPEARGRLLDLISRRP